MRVSINDDTYYYLLKIINDRYKKTEDVEELTQINSLWKSLKYKSDSWVVALR